MKFKKQKKTNKRKDKGGGGGGGFNPIGYWRKFTFSQIWQNLELGKVVDGLVLR